jgi:two-component system nitrogen regulation sensor histidine kinase NtrY
MKFGRTIVLILTLLAVLPLAAAVYLLDEVMSASDRVAAGEAELRKDALEKARAAYRELFAERKAGLHADADRLAQELSTLNETAQRARLVAEVERNPQLEEARLGAFVRKKLLTEGAFRELRVDEPGGLTLIYVTPRAPFAAFEALGEVEASESGLALLHERLRAIFRGVFLFAFVLVVAAALAVGLYVGRRLTRRVTALSAATRAVGHGDLSARVSVGGTDELADLARAFNQMVLELAESRDRISYLQKIGAWQEVARRLAHEIKNPLTPIQLAMQQLQSAYHGDDEKYRQALAASSEIVGEEIAGLRRLVDEFSAFARLPSVQPAPVEAASLVEDFLRSYPDLGVDYAAPQQSPTVLADRMLIKRALYNLVENAREAGARKLQLTLEGNAILLDDDGPGVPPELPLFDPYVTTKEHGTGLGLAIVRKIALEHGGDVTVEKSPLGGARFRLILRGTLSSL